VLTSLKVAQKDEQKLTCDAETLFVLTKNHSIRQLTLLEK